MASPKTWFRPGYVIPAVVLLLFVCHLFRVIDFHELEAIDLRFKLRGEKSAHSDIVLVTIDDPSLAAFGEWPWPRGVYGVLLDILTRTEPNYIFFDILFTEASPDPAEDLKLQAALERAGNVVLPFFYTSEEPFHGSFPLESFQKASRGTGFVNVSADYDGRVRRIKAYIDTPQGRFFQPSVHISGLMRGEGADEWLAALPLDSKNQIWLNYPGTEKAYKRISVAEVIKMAGMNKGAELKALFKGRVVMVGHTATGTTDLKPTPFSTQEVGLVVQATAMHTLLENRPLRKLPEYAHLLMLLIFALAVSWWMTKFKPVHGLLASLGLIAGYWVINLAVFIFADFILPLFMPAAVILLIYAVMLFMKYLAELFVRERMQQELSAAVRIQENFLPRVAPNPVQIDVAYEIRFIKGVGGDLYDWADLGEGKYGFCVGDVSGKGMPAALYMAKSISDFRSISKRDREPGDVCAELNHILATAEVSGMFLTLAYVIVDVKGMTLKYASAGHEPMILFHQSEGKTEVVTKVGGMPLGMFDGTQYESCEIPVKKGDCFVLCSDGVKELRDPKGAEMGIERLSKAVEAKAKSGSTAKDMVKHLFDAMKTYQRGQDTAHDDRTLMCVHFLDV
ncbi:MAG: CHASE2 domain-containing protein [Candidatus Omnitrophota bacterium]|nr:CHASE2 domain-containing protein [Candidatus Omnitrophota bacterium]